ncbi:MAG: T9SS type A sorting domain-containing protein [Bacteroidales bacterium]
MKKLYAVFVTMIFSLVCFSSFAQQDYSLSTFAEPSQNYYCFGSPVYNHVILADSGGTGISAGALNIHWTVTNGTSGLLNGPATAISPDEKDTLELDTFIFARPGAYLLTVYLDSADTNKSNDTLRTWIHISMSGVYTVDPLQPATGNNFQSIAAACDTLSDGGVCGPVIIEIADGQYTEQARIDRVYGVSPINNIVLRSASHDSAAVKITHMPTDASDNYTLSINATSFLTIEDLTLASSGNTSFSRVLTIDSTCAYNHYRNLHLTAPAATVNSNALAVIYSNPGSMTNDSISIFENNRIENGAYGMYLYGASSSNTEDSLVIRKNNIINPYVSGIFMYNQSNTIIDSNVVVTNAVTSNFSGFYLRYGKGNVVVTRNTIMADGAAGDMLYMRDFNGTSANPVLIANNCIYQQNNTATLRGIYPYNCNYVDVAFNTIRIQSGSTTAGRAIYINSSTGYGNIRILNNIFENNGGGYGIEISSTSITNNYVSQCDYNNYNVSGSYLGKYGSTNCADIAAWRTASTAAGFDTHSVEIDPLFAGATSPEFTNAALNNLGLPMTTVTEDIMGTTRNLTNPDMGAYEFELLDHDMVILSIDAPVSGCGLGSTETVTATFFNNGSMPESNVVAKFSINGGSTWSSPENLPAISSGDTITYSFTNSADLSTPGLYNFQVQINPLSDENPNNNIDSVLISSLTTINIFPYVESFESGTGSWNSGGINNSWQLGEPENTVIDTASAGLNCWVTNLTGTHNLNELSYVQSPCFDLSSMSDPWLEMDVWYESEGGWDGAQVQYSSDGGNTWQTLGAYGDANWYNDYDIDGIANNAPGWTGADVNGSNGWITMQHSMFNLTNYSGIRLRVLFGAGSFNNDEGFAFDNIRISDRGNDVEISIITAPESNCGLGINVVSFDAINHGTVTVTSLPVRISADGGATWVNDTIATNITSGTTTNVTTNQTFDFSAAGPHTIIVKSMLPLDLNTANDSAAKTIISQPLISAYPYFDDAESIQVWSTQDTLWTKGVPAGTTINTAFSGSNAYATCNQGPFSGTPTSIIESPCFDMTNMSLPHVEFKYFANSDTLFDGTTFQYSTDGITWNNIGNAGDTLNWYNCEHISALATLADSTGWTGESQSTWKLARHNLSMLTGQPWVRFRFVFSAMNGGNDGFAFDDFSVYENPVYDIAMLSADTLSDACEHGIDSITIRLQNTNFANTIPAGDTIFVALNEGWLNVVMDTIVLSAPFLPQQIITHTFSEPLDMTVNPYTYYIEVQLYNSHDADSSNNAILQIIESFGYPTVTLAADTTFCGDGSILLDAGSGADTYLWSNGSTTSTLLVDTALTNGYGVFEYSVIVTTNGCASSDTTSITFIDCTGLIENEDPINVYPNPAQDNLYIVLPATANQALLTISDMSGKIVLQKAINCEFAGNINTSILAEGVYLLRIISATSNHTQQIIIQR